MPTGRASVSRNYGGGTGKQGDEEDPCKHVDAERYYIQTSELALSPAQAYARPFCGSLRVQSKRSTADICEVHEDTRRPARGNIKA